MNEIQMIATYKAILTTTHQMLEAAQKNDWDTLKMLGQKCKQLTDILIAHPPRRALSNEIQKEKVAIIHQIFACDARIRAITEPEMARLQHLLPNMHKHSIESS